MVKRIKARMAELCISGKALADLCGLSPSTISEVLSGKVKPREKTLEKILGVLGLEREVEDDGLPEECTGVSVKDAARMIGATPQFVRLGLQQGRIPFGIAVKGEGRWSYNISMKKLKEYIG